MRQQALTITITESVGSSCLLVVLTLAATALCAVAAERPPLPFVGLTLRQEEFLPFEPVVVRLELRNDAKTPIMGWWTLSDSHSESDIHVFFRHQDGPAPVPFTLYHPAWRPVGGPPKPDATPLQPGESVRGELLLTCSSPLGKPVLATIGQYELQAQYLRQASSAPVHLSVTNGSPIEREARAFVLKQGLGCLLHEHALHYRPSAAQVADLRRLVEQFPISRYAAYAEIALVAILLESETWRGQEDHIVKWLDDAERRSLPQLVDAVLFYRWRYRTEVRQDVRAADESLAALRRRYPFSRFMGQTR